MKKTLQIARRFLLTAGMLVFATGCLYQDVRLPGPSNTISNYQFTTDDFRILGTVEAEGTITSILGLVQFGGNGERILYEKAKKLGADDIINYHFDLSSYSILLIVYNKANWKARATAIKYTAKTRTNK